LEGVLPSFYDDTQTALESVRSGNNWGALQFSSNYSEAIYERIFGIFQMKKPNGDALSFRCVEKSSMII